ncbi:ribosomal large subunit pseudouridine synthase D [Teredinibacter turnerae T7901]|uniref:Pseudouridine synthase n=1 Tax=Teredinibacter turnerae (strain ATCC 39867 / T7901) TaxID=377629 RepID=C5BQY6_TERTT|nr:23S rRNA pseudouridine(1911/1915/1917) synthase RluD [Teredinibacter turnerae]ACR12830.1 ribosomal large subunit pseudouridine synthase D [Teredinibacter turnerae T7901]
MPNNGSNDLPEPLSSADGPESNIVEAQVPFTAMDSRLDQVAAELFPEFSRARLQQWIKQGRLTVNGEPAKPKLKLAGGECLRLSVLEEPQGEWLPEPIPLDVVYEDEAILVLNKPAGLVVHPAAGNYTGTLLNGLIHHRQAQSLLPRAGIVHRLDKDTSGLMVVAKTTAAQNNLVAQLQARTVKREYEALAIGEVRSSGFVDAPIGRHPTNRTRMAVVSSGKPAVTHYTALARFDGFTHLRLQLETGRTHQIRVHMAHLGYPLVGDPVYGRRLPAKLLRENPDLVPLSSLPRQALHAVQLGLQHPASGEYLQWQVPLAEDINNLLLLLRAYAR